MYDIQIGLTQNHFQIEFQNFGSLCLSGGVLMLLGEGLVGKVLIRFGGDLVGDGVV